MGWCVFLASVLVAGCVVHGATPWIRIWLENANRTWVDGEK